MTQLVAWLSSTAGLGVLGAAIAFIVATILQINQRKAEAREREFQAFHRLVRELVSPDSGVGLMWIDRQAAIVFELRHFPRYYEFTHRMLSGLREKWAADPNFAWPRLIQEIDLTLGYITKKKY